MKLNDRIHIMHIRDSSGIYGAERVILTLGQKIDKKRFKLSVLCMRSEDGNGEKLISKTDELGIQNIPVNVKGRMDFNAILNIRKIFRENTVSIFHSHDFKSNFYGLLASINLPIKRVTTAHGSTRDSIMKRAYLFWDERVGYRFFDKIVAVSENTGRELTKKHVNLEKIEIIQNGLDLESMEKEGDREGFEKPFNIFNRDKIFAVIGRLYPDKGHQYFLHAFSKLSQKDPSIKGLVLGDGPAKEKITRTIHTLKLENRVSLCGVRPDMKNVYNQIDFLIIPSLREGLPYVLLEAMASKVPVLATAVGDIPLLVENGVTGYLVAPGESEGLEKGMIDLLTNPIRAREMADRAYRVVVEKFSADRMVRKTEKLYTSLVN